MIFGREKNEKDEYFGFNNEYNQSYSGEEQITAKAFLFDILESVIGSVIVIILLYRFVAMPEVVHGSSMYPSFEPGERILMERVTRHFKPYERGEVVILHPPGQDNVDFLKRIVALPGDIFRIKDCQVYISKYGETFRLQEFYIDGEVCTAEGPQIKEGHAIRLRDDEFLVLGDNRSNSVDSRLFGVVKRDRILGRVVFRFWPLSRVGFL